MSWTIDQVGRLIDGYEKQPILYNIKHPNYHNKRLRSIALQDIVNDMRVVKSNVTEIDVQKKIHGLRNTYASERRKVTESEKNATRVEEIYAPSLWYYPKLRFLSDYIETRKSAPNICKPVSPEIKIETSVSENEETFSYTEYIEDNTNGLRFESVTLPESAKSPASGLMTPDQISSNSRSSTPRTTKRQKIDDSFDCVAPETIKNRVVAAAVSKSNKSHRNETLDEIFGKYIGLTLLGFKNERNKAEIIYKINKLLYEGKLKELDEN